MPAERSPTELIDKMPVPYLKNTKPTMTSEEALQLIEATLQSKTGKQLTPPEKEILKAAWDNETYNSVAKSLYLSIGYIKDLASLLWQRLSEIFGEKVTKNNLRRVIEALPIASALPEEEIAANYADENFDFQANILIIDDTIENLRFLTDVLTQPGYIVRSVTNGKMALRAIRHHPPDIILLDIKMAEMDGYEVCQALKAGEGTSEIPVIFISLLDEASDKMEAFKVGRVDYIAKPFSAEEIMARIQTQLAIKKQKKQLKTQIEQHQQTAETFYQSRLLLANLLDSSKDGIAAVQAVRDTITEEINDFRCLVANPAFANLFGQNREYIMGKPNLKKFFDRLAPALFDSLVEVVKTGEAIEQEFYWESDRQQILYYLTAVKFGDGCSITIRNITKFKLREFKLKMEFYLAGIKQNLPSKYIQIQSQ